MSRNICLPETPVDTNYDDARDLAFPEIGDLRVTSTDNAQVKHFAKRFATRHFAKRIATRRASRGRPSRHRGR